MDGKEFEAMTNVADTGPRPSSKGTVIDGKWRVIGVLSHSATDLVMDVENVSTIKDEEQYAGFVIKKFVDPSSRTGQFHLLASVWLLGTQKWTCEKSGFVTADEAMEYGRRQAKEWIDQLKVTP